MAETLRDIVWSEEGYLFTRDELFKSDDTGKILDSVFFKGNSIEEALEGRYEITSVWLNKYHSETMFETEEEAIKDVLENQYYESEEISKLLEERLKDLEGESK